MKIIKSKIQSEVMSQCQRPSISFTQISPVIENVFEEVRSKGDIALFEYTKSFDKVDFDSFKVSKELLKGSARFVSDELKLAIKTAASNIKKFHLAQKTEVNIVETSKGVKCWQESRPIERIGIYVPGGSAPLFSTVLMLAIPAQIAGCKEVILCTPPDLNGEVNPAILYAAEMTGVTQVFRIGGAQAIAAMTFGTESIPSVYKIFGPGNQYVTAAKIKAQQFGIAIDMPAGPSELLVYADESAIPEFVASDLLSQAEHGSDSQVICVSESEELIESVQMAIENQISLLPREAIARGALLNSKFILSPDRKFSLDIINDYAPEHLILALKDARDCALKVNNSGSVFIGNYTPESAGDYASGTNHTLPTSGFSKAYSGVNLDAYLKKITFQEISKEGLLEIGNAIEVMSEAERLQGHKNAVSLRLQKIRS